MIKEILNDFTENCYIINEKDEAYIIDPGTNYIDIKNYINDNNLIIKAVLLTHGHFDHIYALNDLLEDFDSDVYIHELERDFLFDANLNLSSSTYNKFILNKKLNVKTYKDKDVFKLRYNNIKVIHTPGHTRGSSCFIYKNYCFSGDTLFKGAIGRYDLPTSSKVEITRSLKMLSKVLKDNTVIYPGHGPFTTMINEKYDNIYLK